MKNIFVFAVSCVLLAGCSKTRTPDRIEVLHMQPVFDEYIVAEGDTVNQIAQKFDMDPERLVSINNLMPPYTISVGQALKVDSEDAETIIVKQIFSN